LKLVKAPLDQVLLLTLAAYLLGSVPIGYLLGRWLRGIDIRTVGSGNLGATNVTRELGLPCGVVAFAFDFGKGLIPAHFFARALDADPYSLVLPMVFGSAAILGHIYPIYLKFRGGKGVATSAGVLASISTLPTLAALLVWAIVLGVSRRVSVASMAGAVTLPVVETVAYRRLRTEESLVLLVFCSIVAVVILWRHRKNVRNLIKGTEPGLREIRDASDARKREKKR